MVPTEPKEFDQNVDTLAKFEPSFQIKVIASILQSPRFLTEYIDLVNPNYFDADGSKWVINKTLMYFSEYTDLPTLAFFKAELSKESDTLIKTEVVNTLREVFTRIKADSDLQYVRDSLVEFSVHQLLKSAILKSVDYLQEDRYDEIKSAIDHAMRAGQAKNLGLDWKKDIELRLTRLARNTVATGWLPIDEAMDGGLAAGELGVIVAPSGIGKSWALSAIGANALKNGKKVIHYSLELNENYVGIRYDTIFTGIEPSKIPMNIPVVKKAIEQITGEIIIKFYPTKSITCNTITSHVQQLHALGFTPDIIIIDYADLLRSTERSDTRHQELGAIYEQLRCLAGELNIPIWTASQSQRSSIQDDVIQADKIAESYNKVMTADFLLSISRKLEDKVNHTGRVHIMKNRFGPDGQTFPMHMNPSRGIIEIYDENSSQGVLLKKKMLNGEETMKKNLAEQFSKMTDNFLEE
jgi:replicative DNA helicase